ncbi:MAG: sulfatase [Runella sp.]
MKINVLDLLFLGIVFGFTFPISQNTTNTQPPNIVLIVADDLGRNDLGCYGNRFIETPTLDRLAKEGVQFMNAYAAAPLCSPTRASLVTGNNPARINLTEHLHGYAPPSPKQKLIPPRIVSALPPELVTLPEALKKANYKTGHFGKWHLGGGISSPAGQGFDMVYGGGVEGLPKTFFYPFFHGTPYPDLLADTQAGDYLDDALTHKAVQFIRQHQKERFFVELHFYSPHVPIEGKAELVEKYHQKRQNTKHIGLPNDEYAAMVEGIDQNVAKVLACLHETGLAQNTLLVFVSDNGGLDVQEVPDFAKHTPPTTNAPLRGGKGSVYEGGIRIPCVVYAPHYSKIKGKTNALLSTDDIFNTFMAVAGQAQTAPDGQSILPILLGNKQSPRHYFLHFPHYSPQRGQPAAVIRSGRYKLIEWFEGHTLELYDLQKDESESRNIAAQNPQIANKLLQRLHKWQQSMNAKMPEPNPNYRAE